MHIEEPVSESTVTVDEKLDRILVLLQRFSDLLERFGPTLEKLEQGGVRALLTKRKGDVPQWPMNQ